MNTDFSRQRFDAWNDFSSVLQQQGRVLLDAEWNEFNEIIDRRWRAETIDIIGRGVVPKQTPDGFKPVWDPATKQLTIGPGRIYVDGLLAENHGKAATEKPLDFDPALSELRGGQPIKYEEQPYYPNPQALPTGIGPHLIYIDVWHREVTNLEIPSLVEPAVGIDTTTRLQTAWQVRVLENAEGTNLSCSTPDDQIPGWLDLTTPSAGRLTTAATGVPTSDDPCLIPPTGGYRSLENRCYRIEIHSVDPNTGAATFKWARDNRSMTAAITSVPAPNQIVVDRVQWDSILGFSAGDWVEITDDWRELAGLPGIIAKISAQVDDSTRTIPISVNLSTTDFPLDTQQQPDPDRHMRIRKWDHSGIVRDSNGNVIKDLNADNAGVIPVKTDGTSILIEDGIQVTFSLAAVAAGPSRFRVGDYWVFAARAADASVEILTAAPPHGVHHHYCRLGFITATGATDCRPLWPPDFGEDCCACPVCVTPDSHASGTMTLQQAIDKVKDTGGTVCVASGNYILEVTLQVVGAKSVRLKGQGWQTVLVSVPSGEIPVAELAILIQDSEDIVVEDLAVTSSIILDANQPIIGVLNSSEITIRHDLVVTTATDLTRLESARANLKEGGGIAVALGGRLQNIRVQENIFLTAVGVADWRIGANPDAPADVSRMTCTGLQIDNNLLQCSLSGVRLQDTSVLLGPATVTSNFIIGCREAAVSVTGVVDSTVLSGSHFDAAGNTLRVLGDGIVIGVSEARVTGNDISTLLSGNNVRALNAKIAGIALVTGASKLPLDRCQILANRLTRLVGIGVAIRGAVSSVMIKQNFIEKLLGGGIVMEADSKTALLTIENNQITNVGNPTGTDGFQVVAGIFLVNADQVEVAHNAIGSVGTKVTALSFVFGIAVLASSKIKITGNRLVNIGPPDTPLRMAAGVFVAGSFENLEVSANHIRRANVPFTQVVADNSIWLALLIGGFEKLNVHTLGDSMLVSVEHTHFLLGNATATAVSDLPEMATVHENMIDAYGIAVPIRIRVSGTCVFSDNQCRFKPAEKQSVVEISAGAIAMNSNFIENMTNAVAAQLTTGPTNYVVLGNITRGTILVNGAALGSTNIPLNASV